MQFTPMLVSSGALPADSERFAYEVKWDGFRALVHVSPAGTTIISRNGHDMTARYPELAGVRARTPALFDGELVCLDERGRPDFAALWGRGRGSATTPVCFMAFDVLRRGDDLLIDLPYRDRRRILEDEGAEGSHWCTPPSHVGEGDALFRATREMGLEGVVAKRRDSRYRPGMRTRSWVKAKHFQTRTFALLGWVPPHEWRGDRGCVVLGLHSGGRIAFAGVVETGYGRDVVEQLPQVSRAGLRRLEERGSEDAPPLRAEIKYLEWVPGMGLRHATVHGLLPPERS